MKQSTAAPPAAEEKTKATPDTETMIRMVFASLMHETLEELLHALGPQNYGGPFFVKMRDIVKKKLEELDGKL